MKNKIAFFLPTRKGSQRVINKNTRPFAGFKGGLLENKLQQLLLSEKIDEIILSTNDEECIKIAESVNKNQNRIYIIRRPEYLCLDTTNLQDLIAYVPTITKAEHILWGHVTTPLVDAKMYDSAINVYMNEIENGSDSLVSVTEFKNFLLNKGGQCINNNTELRWPRTQDLNTLYEINHAMFITSRKIYELYKNRIGNKPFLYKMNKIDALDVDYEDEFNLTELAMIMRNRKENEVQ